MSLRTGDLLLLPIDLKAVTIIGALDLGLPTVIQATGIDQGDIEIFAAADVQLGIDIG